MTYSQRNVKRIPPFADSCFEPWLHEGQLLHYNWDFPHCGQGAAGECSWAGPESLERATGDFFQFIFLHIFLTSLQVVPIDIANDAVTTADYKVHLQRQLRKVSSFCSNNLNVKLKKKNLNPAQKIATSNFNCRKTPTPSSSNQRKLVGVLSQGMLLRSYGLDCYLDIFVSFLVSWWIPLAKFVLYCIWPFVCYILVFQELEGKFRTSDDCIQACHRAVQVVRIIVGRPSKFCSLMVPKNTIFWVDFHDLF